MPYRDKQLLPDRELEQSEKQGSREQRDGVLQVRWNGGWPAIGVWVCLLHHRKYYVSMQRRQSSILKGVNRTLQKDFGD